MRRLIPAATLAVLIGVVLVPSADAARGLTITGTLKGTGTKGARVVAVAANGASVGTATRNGRFRLRLPAKLQRRGLTLSLVSARGAYLGPVVLRRALRPQGRQAGGRASIALSGGATGTLALGTVRLADGAATTGAALPVSAIGPATVQLDADGVPLGAGGLGYVDTTQATDDVRPGVDADRDGIVNAFDVDLNGNEILNAQDPATAGALDRAANHPFLFTSMFVPFLRAAASSPADFSANVRDLLTVNFGVGTPPDGTPPSAVDVDCQGIPWCATATIATRDYQTPAFQTIGAGQPWPRDPASGLYPVGHRLNSPTFDTGVRPNALPAAGGIVAGQAFSFSLAEGAATRRVPLVLAPFFAAPPVPTRIGTTDITASPTAGSSEANQPAIPIGGTVVAITTLRPLRPAIPGAEPGVAISMGNLNYGIVASRFGVAEPPVTCPVAAYTGLSPTLTAQTGPSRSFGAPLVDRAPDAAPSPTRTVSFTVDLAQCGFAAGQIAVIDIVAADQENNNASAMGIKLQL